MKKFNYNQAGGFPLETETLQDLQDALLIFEKYAAMLGDYAIVSGCEVQGSTISDGVVAIKGELFVLKGSILQPNVIIKESTANALFEDGDNKIIQTDRFVTFGSAVNQVPWINFKRVKDLNLIDEKITTHENKKNNPHQVTAKQIGFKSGSIYIGDVQGKDIGWNITNTDYSITLIDKTPSAANGGTDLYKIIFTNENFGTNYKVFITPVFAGEFAKNTTAIFSVTNKTSNGFEIAIRELIWEGQSITLDYLIFQ